MNALRLEAAVWWMLASASRGNLVEAQKAFRYIQRRERYLARRKVKP